jgi:hypothetical protein
LFYCIRKENNLQNEDKVILLLFVDEVKKVEEHGNLRRKIAESLKYFNNTSKTYNQHNILKLGFTSYTISDIKIELKSSDSPTLLHVNTIDLETAKKLFVGYAGVRDANNKLIEICLGFQRGLEFLYKQFVSNQKEATTLTRAKVGGEGTSDDIETTYFTKMIGLLQLDVSIYIPNSWLTVEQIVCGREIRLRNELITLELTQEEKKDKEFFENAISRGICFNEITDATETAVPQSSL